MSVIKSRPSAKRGGGANKPPKSRKSKSLRDGLKKLMAYLSPFRQQLLGVAILAVCSTVFMIAGPKILAKATDELANGISRMMQGQHSGIDLGSIGLIALLLVGLYLLGALFTYMQGHVMARVATDISYRLRNQIISKINRMPLGYFHRTSQGDVLSRMTNDVDTIEQSLTQSVTQLISSTSTIVGVIIMMFTISVKLTFIVIILVPLSLLIVVCLARFSQNHFRHLQRSLGKLNGRVEEVYSGHIVMKAFNGERKELARFDLDNEQLASSAKMAEFYSGLMMPVLMFTGNLGYVVTAVAGASMAASGRISIGDIQAFIQYVRNFTQPITQMASLSSQVQRMVAASERVFEFLEEEEETMETGIFGANGTHTIHGHIRFEQVRFGYQKNKPILKDFNLNVEPGQRVAIVGPTGAGKTTIVKLLMRFYELDGGVIYVDGQDLTVIRRHDFRSQFGMVLQDTWLFNGTILENIRYGRLSANNDEVMKAAKEAQADHFIRTLPDGYETELNEDSSNLSQGQRQLLTIARAILADPKVLILDEATSSIDTRTEQLIQLAMERLMLGRTSFIIAHRLSTIQSADLILCMNDGDVVEQGTHNQLMRKNGFYASLYNSQFSESEVG
jgi:ABC-type multidrug transport system, ATPase and permease components